MKAQELRIGNLILGEYYNDQDIECEETVKFLGYDPHEQWYWVEGSGNIERYSGFKPITLNEEWLLKFKKYSKWKWFGDDNYGGYIDFIGEWKLMLRYWNGKFIFTVVTIDKKRDFYKSVKQINLKIEYVHQLQNLYFALTGEELTIK